MTPYACHINHGDADMTASQTTAKFLAAIDAATKSAILSNIASNYGISQSAAYDEVTDDEAEHLLEYVTGPQRAATSALMQRHGMRASA